MSPIPKDCHSRFKLSNWYIHGEAKIVHCTIVLNEHLWHMCDGYKWKTEEEFKETKEEMAIHAKPMSFDGEIGVFLTSEDYLTLCNKAAGQELTDYARDLEIDNQNLRNAIEEAHIGLTQIRYDLGNA